MNNNFGQDTQERINQLVRFTRWPPAVQ